MQFKGFYKINTFMPLINLNTQIFYAYNSRKYLVKILRFTINKQAIYLHNRNLMQVGSGFDYSKLKILYCMFLLFNLKDIDLNQKLL